MKKMSEQTSKLKDTAAGIGGCLLYLALAFGSLTLIILLLRGMGWVAVNVYPWAVFAAGIALFIVVPISLLLSIFEKSRHIGSIGLFISSYVVGLSIWIWSLIIAYSLAGTFWLIVGLIFGGIGVVPVALIAALFSREWSVAGQILMGAIVVYAMRWFSLFLEERLVREKAAESFVNEYLLEEAKLEEAKEITQAYGSFLAEGAPIIADAKFLPYTKAQIKHALLTYEKHLCDIGNMLVESGKSEKLQELDKLLNSIRVCSMSVNSYCDIEPEDEDDVEYFNSYNSINEVPEEERTQCSELMVKYMSKGMEEEMPGWTEIADAAAEKVIKREQ
jgi:hypothetical protein